MKCNLGESLADYGFSFLEKIHQPIFLVTKLGRIVKINEAGRKLAHIGHFNIRQIENLIINNIIKNSDTASTQKLQMGPAKPCLKVITTPFKGSDYFLVEIKR